MENLKSITSSRLRTKAQTSLQISSCFASNATGEKEDVKTCITCNTEKPIYMFRLYREKTNPTRGDQCERCRGAEGRRKKGHRDVKTRRAYHNGSDWVKLCSKCCKEKSVTEFHRTITSSDGLKSACKSCYSYERKKIP